MLAKIYAECKRRADTNPKCRFVAKRLAMLSANASSAVLSAEEVSSRVASAESLIRKLVEERRSAYSERGPPFGKDTRKRKNRPSSSTKDEEEVIFISDDDDADLPNAKRAKVDDDDGQLPQFAIPLDILVMAINSIALPDPVDEMAEKSKILFALDKQNRAAVNQSDIAIQAATIPGLTGDSDKWNLQTVRVYDLKNLKKSTRAKNIILECADLKLNFDRAPLTEKIQFPFAEKVVFLDSSKFMGTVLPWLRFPRAVDVEFYIATDPRAVDAHKFDEVFPAMQKLVAAKFIAANEIHNLVAVENFPEKSAQTLVELKCSNVSGRDGEPRLTFPVLKRLALNLLPSTDVDVRMFPAVEVLEIGGSTRAPKFTAGKEFDNLVQIISHAMFNAEIRYIRTKRTDVVIATMPNVHCIFDYASVYNPISIVDLVADFNSVYKPNLTKLTLLNFGNASFNVAELEIGNRVTPSLSYLKAVQRGILSKFPVTCELDYDEPEDFLPANGTALVFDMRPSNENFLKRVWLECDDTPRFLADVPTIQEFSKMGGLDGTVATIPFGDIDTIRLKGVSLDYLERVTQNRASLRGVNFILHGGLASIPRAASGKKLRFGLLDDLELVPEGERVYIPLPAVANLSTIVVTGDFYGKIEFDGKFEGFPNKIIIRDNARGETFYIPEQRPLEECFPQIQIVYDYSN